MTDGQRVLCPRAHDQISITVFVLVGHPSYERIGLSFVPSMPIMDHLHFT
jgi:hypothetical protein